MAKIIGIGETVLDILFKNDQPVKVPRLILQTEDEELAWSHGIERQKIRKMRKATALDGI